MAFFICPLFSHFLHSIFLTSTSFSLLILMLIWLFFWFINPLTYCRCWQLFVWRNIGPFFVESFIIYGWWATFSVETTSCLILAHKLHFISVSCFRTTNCYPGKSRGKVILKAIYNFFAGALRCAFSSLQTECRFIISYCYF